MLKNIQMLDKLLSDLRPEFYAGFQESLNDAEIESLEKKYRITLPEDLRELYKWKNGQRENCFEAFVNNSMFIALEEALETAKEYNAMIGTDFEIENWWNKNWIPIFHNGGGDYICYDCGGLFTGKKGQLIEFWHGENDRNVIAPSLESFVISLIKYYEDTLQDEFDEFFEIGNIKGYPKNFFVE